jgi:hypothetical protein
MRGIFRGGVLIVLLSCCQIAAALEPIVKINIETPQRPVVNGQTNLPDGTNLMISISRKESNYSAEDKVEVAGGRFRTQKFSQKGSDLNPGRYSVEVLMPFPGVQSEGVRSVIGEHGEELTGPLVKHEELGNLVKYVSTFQVGEAADAKADNAARAQEKKDNEKWVRDSCNWIFDTTETLRREGKLTGRELTPDERQAKFDNCVKEVSGKKK